MWRRRRWGRSFARGESIVPTCRADIETGNWQSRIVEGDFDIEQETHASGTSGNASSRPRTGYRPGSGFGSATGIRCIAHLTIPDQGGDVQARVHCRVGTPGWRSVDWQACTRARVERSTTREAVKAAISQAGWLPRGTSPAQACGPEVRPISKSEQTRCCEKPLSVAPRTE